MKLEPGKYYMTRDGRKVGPVYEYDEDSWYAKMENYLGGGLWNDDGSPYYEEKEIYDSPTLIAEWTDAQPEEPAHQPTSHH